MFSEKIKIKKQLDYLMLFLLKKIFLKKFITKQKTPKNSLKHLTKSFNCVFSLKVFTKKLSFIILGKLSLVIRF